MVEDLAARGVALRSLHEAIDTPTPSGPQTLNLFASLAEFEREPTAERTVAGLPGTRTRGSCLGRPAVWTPERRQAAVAMLGAGASVTATARTAGVSRASVYRLARDQGLG